MEQSLFREKKPVKFSGMLGQLIFKRYQKKIRKIQLSSINITFTDIS